MSAHIAGIISGMEKAAAEYRSLSAKQLRNMTFEHLKSWAGQGEPKTNPGRLRAMKPKTTSKVVGGIADAATKVTKKPTGLSADKLRSAMEKAKANPGGKMHQLLAQRAKLKAGGGA